MDNSVHLDPSQKLPLPPQEKLLRAPTFWEKNAGKVNWLLLFLIVIVLAIGGFSINLQSNQGSKGKTCGYWDGDKWSGSCAKGYTCYAPFYKISDNHSLGHCTKEKPTQPTAVPVSTEAPQPTAIISTTCTPRPACLDATPRCMIPETADMCPK